MAQNIGFGLVATVFDRRDFHNIITIYHAIVDTLRCLTLRSSGLMTSSFLRSLCFSVPVLLRDR